MQHPIDLLKRCLRIAQNRRGDRELVKHLLLRVELAHFVVKQRVLFAFFHPRRAADDDHRRLFSEGFGGGIGHLQTTNAVGDANGSQAPDTGISISGKAGTLFIAGVDDAQFAFREQIVETQHIVAGNPKDVAHALPVKPLDEVFANRRRVFH